MKCVEHAKTLAEMAILIKLARQFALRRQRWQMAEALVQSQRVLLQTNLKTVRNASVPPFAVQLRMERLPALLTIPRRVRFQPLGRSATFVRSVTKVTVLHQTIQSLLTAIATQIAASVSSAASLGRACLTQIASNP